MTALERKLHSEEEKLGKINEKRGEAEGGMVVSKRELLSREKELKKLSMDVSAFDNEEENLKRQIKAQKKVVENSKADPAQVKEMEKNCKKLQKIYEEANENARELKENVGKLNKKIKEIHNSKVKSVQANLDSVHAKVDKFKKEITRLEVEIKSSERNLKKSKDKYEAYDLEVTEAEEKLLKMKDERDASEAEGTIFFKFKYCFFFFNFFRENSNYYFFENSILFFVEIILFYFSRDFFLEIQETLFVIKYFMVILGTKMVEKIKTLETQCEELTEELQEAKKALVKLEEKETKYKSERIEIDQTNEKFASALKENAKTIHHWKREISKLKLEDIPGEDREELKEFSKEELEEKDVDQYKMELNVLEENLSSKRPDLKAIEEFKRKESVYLERVSELDEISQKRDRARKRHDDLRKTRLNEFMEGFGIITGKLKEMYQVIFFNTS